MDPLAAENEVADPVNNRSDKSANRRTTFLSVRTVESHLPNLCQAWMSTAGQKSHQQSSEAESLPTSCPTGGRS